MSEDLLFDSHSAPARRSVNGKGSVARNHRAPDLTCGNAKSTIDQDLGEQRTVSVC